MGPLRLPMRVLQVHNRYREPGGEDAVVDAEADLLRVAGHQVSQFQVENPPTRARATLSLAASPWNLRSARHVAAYAAAQPFDVAHVHNTWFTLSVSVLRALRGAGIPVVATMHNYRLTCANGQLARDGRICELCVDGSPIHGIRYKCYRQSRVASAVVVAGIQVGRMRNVWTRDVDALVVMTEFGKTRLEAAGVPSHTIRVKPHFVTDPGPRPSAPSESRTILYVGRLSPEKGLRTLLEAWVRAEPSDLKLAIVGDGPLRRELEAHRLRNVSFLGWIPEEQVTAQMLRARALVFPSEWYETFGLTVVEAMASGLPVVASDLGGIPEVLGSGASPWLCAPFDPAAFATGLGHLERSSTAEIDNWGATLRTEYERRFTPARGLENLEVLYRDVAGIRRA